MIADNQQERFISNELGHYLAGFADGEGSFNVSFRKRNDYRLPWKISLCFNISQKEFEILKLFQTTLQCGTLRSRPDGVWYYEVNNLKEIISIIIPFSGIRKIAEIRDDMNDGEKRKFTTQIILQTLE